MLKSFFIIQPFGNGLVTVVVPPLRRGDNSLLLWNMKNITNPVHTFFGHSDVVIEFGWRKPSDGKCVIAIFCN